MRTSVKRALGAGVFAGIAVAAWRAWAKRVPPRPTGLEWSSAPFPFPPVPRVTDEPAAAPTPADDAPERADAPAAAEPSPNGRHAWVEPAGDGSCPDGYPVKAKLGSGIFHVPGGANYERTHPDRCYANAAAAEADGLRASKV